MTPLCPAPEHLRISQMWPQTAALSGRIFRRGNYYVQLAGEGEEQWYIKSAVAGGRDINESGLSINGGTVMLDLVASADGERLPESRSTVKANRSRTLRSWPFRSRACGVHPDFKKTVSDESGHFNLRGIRPGNYTVFAWERASKAMLITIRNFSRRSKGRVKRYTLVSGSNRPCNFR